MWTQGRVATVMHLIRYCSVSDNKCGRLSDWVHLRHVSLGASFCQHACLRLSSPPHVLLPSLLLCSVFGYPYLFSPPQHTHNPSVLSTNHNLIFRLPVFLPIFRLRTLFFVSRQLCSLSSCFSSSVVWLAHVSGLGLAMPAFGESEVSRPGRACCPVKTNHPAGEKEGAQQGTGEVRANHPLTLLLSVPVFGPRCAPCWWPGVVSQAILGDNCWVKNKFFFKVALNWTLGASYYAWKITLHGKQKQWASLWDKIFSKAN